VDRPELADTLGLGPHPEGGWYRETYRSSVTFEPDGYDGSRTAATAIYYLLQPGESSRWHVVASDELWLWHAGGPLEISLGGAEATPMREPHTVVLGSDVANGERPQVLVPAGVWQAARPVRDEAILVTCVVTPGFDFADFRLAD
jgi:predicted cupin superfamily sugar epimerase